jgi:hypothetical protein
MADIQLQKTQKSGVHDQGDNRIIGCPVKTEKIRFDTAWQSLPSVLHSTKFSRFEDKVNFSGSRVARGPI